MNEHEQRLSDFLKANPKAQKMQFMIEKRLRRCATQEAKMVMMYEMMMDSVNELRTAILGNDVQEAEIIECDFWRRGE